jgi:hypothetical protein
VSFLSRQCSGRAIDRATALCVSKRKSSLDRRPNPHLDLGLGLGRILRLFLLVLGRHVKLREAVKEEKKREEEGDEATIVDTKR